MATSATSADFEIVTSDRSLGRNMPQQIGRKLWLPMWLMAGMAFAVGFGLAVVRAGEIADGGAADTIMALRHSVAGFMFIGFASVFAAISFAIARILGEFRAGGGELQEATGRHVRTLKMPITAKLFIITMAMAMMAIIATVVLHFVFAADVTNTAASLETAEQRFVVLEGVRRIGVAVYLVSFLLGLGTIIEVLRFQAIRIRELAGEAVAS
ncbi:MAG TPA: hypothetical protein QF624_03400 [Dehalococcoidia bacterium]|nr:hypothetical protein [Dehalococcoidia bacterium]